LNSGNSSGSDEDNCDDHVVEGWVEAFGMADVDVDDDDSDDDIHEEDNESNEQDEGECDDLNKYAYETQTSELDPWPDWTTWDKKDTFEKWPQENAKHYKEMKKQYGPSYVRTDKYELSRMVECFWESEDGGETNDWTLPPMESAYGANYK
jgi:hypothetical protein